jgi:hypothetical protein
MGLDVRALRLLLLAHQAGARFDQTITLGRQDLLLTIDQIVQTCKPFGLHINAEEAARIAFGADRFSEPLLHKLGAQITDSLDASGFEGATVIHDLNLPLPPELKEKYSVVFDGGTLEHVFNFPNALRTCMEMLSEGGHFIMASPSNNQMGHGFYQFSPELFYRVFSSENGYNLKALFLAPAFSDGVWYRVIDPAIAGCRIGYNAGFTAFSLFAIAERTKIVPIFAKPPQQSDYLVEWSDKIGKQTQSRLWFFDEAVRKQQQNGVGLKAKLSSLLPARVKHLRNLARAAKISQDPPNPTHFIPVEFS